MNHRGFSQSLHTIGRRPCASTTKSNMPLLYWTAAAWGAAITVSKDKPDIVADLPKMEALIDRALELDEKFDHGAIHTFLINYEIARPGAKADEAATRAKQHFERAMRIERATVGVTARDVCGSRVRAEAAARGVRAVVEAGARHQRRSEA